MAILVDEDTIVVVQGITGRMGAYHSKAMKDYGTKVVGGVTPGKAGQEVNGIPVYDYVEDVVNKHGANASVIIVPAAFVKNAALEAIEAGVKIVFIAVEGVPLHDAAEVLRKAKMKGSRIIGPNSLGVISPGKCKLGMYSEYAVMPGNVGVITRSGSMCYEVAIAIKRKGIGQSTIVDCGADVLPGTTMREALEMFEGDPETKAVLMAGEIGGIQEETAAEFIKKMSKPVVSFVAGVAAPPGKRMGHAGAIVERGMGTAESKRKALSEAGAILAKNLKDLPELVAEALKRRK